MKKSLAFIFFALVTIVTFAQSNSKLENKKIARISYAVKGGLNLSNMLIIDDDGTRRKDTKNKTGFNFGITAGFPISKTVDFETGLLLSTKGFKISDKKINNGITYEDKGSTNLLYLDIPLTAKTYYNIGASRIYGVFGPYLGVGLSGKSKYESISINGTESDEQDVNWGSGVSDDIKRMDFGLTLGAGMEINSVLIGLSYNLGLANISGVNDHVQKINNKVLGLSIGYKFKSKE